MFSLTGTAGAACLTGSNLRRQNTFRHWAKVHMALTKRFPPGMISGL
jgi:hypothetical protein